LREQKCLDWFEGKIVRFEKIILIVLFLISSHALAADSGDVLVIGDSHTCGSFGSSLVKDIAAGGAKVDAYCAVSTSAESWVKGSSRFQCETWTESSKTKSCDLDGKGRVPPLKDILSQKHYSKVIIALGTNSLLSPSADHYYADLAKIAQSTGASCSWVGPPHIRPDQAKGFSESRLEAEDKNVDSFYGSLDPSLKKTGASLRSSSRKTVSNFCNVVDSRPATAASDKVGGKSVDGVHRGKIGGAYWATQTLVGLNKTPTAKVMCSTLEEVQGAAASGQACVNP
jgi:hypothetical protein